MGVQANLVLAVADDGRAALAALQTRGVDTASFHAVVLRVGELPLVLVEVGIPIVNDRFEFRTSGLWVEAVPEQPGIHWSYGLEAFALAIERPDDLLGQGYGHRTPLGWELDFVTGPADASAWPGVEVDPDLEVDREVEAEAGRLDGLMLTARGPEGERPFAGPAWRATLSGPSPPMTPPPRPDLPAMVDQPQEVALPWNGVGAGGPVWWVGHDGSNLTSRWSSH